ncbi:MAG: acyltransferase [Bacteroidota bacterium]
MTNFMTEPTEIGILKINSRLSGLDHLRSLAILLVFMYHSGRLFPHAEWTNKISNFGWTGVDLFFVLSGYLIASQLFAKIGREQQISLREFFIKRLFRIIPAYSVVVAIYFLFQSFHEREALAPLWKYLTFTQNLGLDITTQGTFSHAWSLCIEEQFYLLLPLTLVMLVYFNAIEKGFIILILLFALGIFIKLYAWYSLVLPLQNAEGYYLNWYKWIYYPTYSRLDGLLMGVSIAALFQFKTNIKDKILMYGNQSLLVSVFVLTGASFLCSNLASFNTTFFGFPLIALGYGFMLIGAISPSSFLYKFNSRVTANIATLSYSIYLTHKFIIHLTQENFSKINVNKDSTLMFLACIITTISGAFLLNIVVERPFLELRNKILLLGKAGR